MAGACLVACGLWIWVKDNRYEKRVDQMLADKDKHAQQYADLLSKYQAFYELVVELLKAERTKKTD